MSLTTLRGIAALTLLGACLTGCADSSSASDQMTIGVLPSVESAPLFLGQDEGIFKKHGVNLNIVSFASGSAAMVAPVVSGDYDIAVADLLTLMSASSDGDKVQLIAPAGSSSGSTEKDFGAVVVAADSPIESLADLEGASVGSNSLLDTNNTVLRSTMDASGAASFTVQWKEIAFQNAQAAVESGEVSAAFLVEPYLTGAVNDGLRVLSRPYAEFDEKLDVNAYFTSTTFAADNPELLESFTAALVESIEFADKYPHKVREVVNAYYRAPSTVWTKIALPSYTTTFDQDAAAGLAASAVKFAVLPEGFDVAGFLP